MQITFLLTQSIESPGGGGRYFPLAKALVAQGYEVTIFALHHNFRRAEQRRFVRDGVTVEYVGQMHVLKKGNHKEYFSPLSLIWVSALGTLRLSLAALRCPGDLIHLGKTQPMNGMAGWIAHHLRRVPVYADSDDLEAVNNRFGGRWQQRIVAWFENWIPSFASGLTVGTTFIGEHFQALGYPAARIAHVPNGADRDRFAILNDPEAASRITQIRREIGLKEGQPVVVYVGSMSLTSHAVDLLLEAFAAVPARLPQARLVLVGGGEDLEQLRALAGQLGISSHTHFIGRVSAEDVPYYYRLGTVTVDPMRDSLPARSSLSLKLIESIAAGVPCITADIGDRRVMVGDAGIAVPPGDVCALTEALVSVVDDPRKAAQMKQAASELRERNWWDVRVHRFTSLYPDAG